MSNRFSTLNPDSNNNEAYWRKVIAHYESSGLQQKEFCAQEGIRFGSFRNWLYRLRLSDKQKHLSPEHVPLFSPVIAEAKFAVSEVNDSVESALVLELGGDIRVIVNAGFGAQTLRRLIDVVRGSHV